MNFTTEVLAEEWLKTYVKRGEAITESKGCELPSGDNLRKGDVVHLRAKFVRPAEFAPRTHGVFDIGGLVQFSPFAEIVDVELPPLKIGDRVVTPDGKRGTVADVDCGAPDLVFIALGYDGWGVMIPSIFVPVDSLVRAD